MMYTMPKNLLSICVNFALATQRRLERSTPEGSETYVIEKSRLSVRLIPPYSEERLAAARKYAKQHGFQVLRTEKESA